MKRGNIAKVLMSVLLAVLIPLSVYSDAGRGVKIISIKDDKGKDIKLYKESYALIIGASNYTAGWPKLPGVKKDVEEVKEILQKHGFNVTVVSDPNREQLIQAFEKFVNKYGLKPDNRLLFYFAGHGHTIKQTYGEEMGYIIPIDAPNPNKDKEGFLTKAMDMQMIEVFAKRIQSKHAMFLFDSCFSGSIFALSRAVPENISYKTAKPVRQFITSGSAEEQVPDKSIFRQQFISAIEGEADRNKDGYVTGTELGEYLQDTVVNYSRGSQHPQYGKIRNPNLDKGDFVFQLVKAYTGAPASKAPEVELAEPSKGGFSIDDLEKQGQQIEKNRTAWNAKLKEMKNAYNQVMAYERKSVTPDLKAAAWERFVSSFGEDNPYSTEDDAMKIEAEQRVSHWQAEKQKAEEKKIAMAPRPSKTTSGSSYTDPATGMELVLVKGGCYQMGDIFGDGDSDEKPVHEVCVDDYYIGKYEVTQGQWKAIMGNNPSDFKNCGDDCPVEGVSWNDIKDFIKRLNNRSGGGKYRLPTEAEWEYAARSGGKSEKYSGGNDIDSVAWYTSNSGGKTHPVGTKQPNGLGIYDMSGNVWEWVQDWYGSGYYKNSPRNNPTGPSSGASRVLRGGSWGNDARDARAANRIRVNPDARYGLGFRLARTK